MYYETRKFGYYLINKNAPNVLAALQDYVYGRDIYADAWEDKNRPGLKDLFGNLQSGDTIYFYSLDNIFDNNQLLKQMLELLKKNNVVIRVLDLPSSLSESIYTFDDEENTESIIINLIIDFIDKAANKERAALQHLQALGLSEAKSQGVKLGRKPKPFPDTFKEDYKAWKNGECTASSIYKRYGWSNPCFYKKIKEFEKSLYA